MLGAYKTTKIDVIEHEASVELLDLQLERRIVTHATRSINSQGSKAIARACDTVWRQAANRLDLYLSIPESRTKRLCNRTQGTPKTAKSTARKEIMAKWADC